MLIFVVYRDAVQNALTRTGRLNLMVQLEADLSAARVGSLSPNGSKTSSVMESRLGSVNFLVVVEFPGQGTGISLDREGRIAGLHLAIGRWSLSQHYRIKINFFTATNSPVSIRYTYTPLANPLASQLNW